jgi:hypothetical protein
MNGFAGSSLLKKQKQELAGSSGAVPVSKTESGDPVVGLAVRIVKIIAEEEPRDASSQLVLQTVCKRGLLRILGTSK